MTYRNRRLLDLAHAMPCQAKFEHACIGYESSEPAHSDSLIFGRGANHKSSDWAYAAMCHNAHVLLDNFSREVKQAEWLRAYIATQDYIWGHGMVRVA